LTAAVDFIDLGGITSALMDGLDAWVRRGRAPTPSREDVGGSLPPVAHPEIACPLGVLYAPGGQAETRFAAFDGTSLEPTDPITGSHIDMNGNGLRDRREAVTEAWRRLGLVSVREMLSGRRYRQCVARAAAGLRRHGLLTANALTWYVTEADDYLARTGTQLR
jgi:hypothetical protein